MRRALRVIALPLTVFLGALTLSTMPSSPGSRPGPEGRGTDKPARRSRENVGGSTRWSDASSRLLRLVAFCAVLLGCLAVTTAAAALALGRSRLERLDTETASRLQADYSADTQEIEIAPLDPQIIEAAAEDEAALTDPAQRPRRVQIVHVHTETPLETIGQATSTPPLVPAIGTPTRVAPRRAHRRRSCRLAHQRPCLRRAHQRPCP